MRGELKSLFSMEIGDLEQYVPDDPECFGFHVVAFIGPADDESSDSFDFVVCSPRWLTRSFVDVRLDRWEYESENLLFGRRLVLMRRWNYQELQLAIADMSAAQAGADWGTLADRIGRYVPWEVAYRYDEFIDSAAAALPAFPLAADGPPTAGESRSPAVATLDANGPWDLPLAGFEVLQATFAYPIDLVAYGPDGVSASLRFEGAFSLIEADGAVVQLDASESTWEELAAVLALRHDRLQSVWADDAAALAVEFASGRRIEAGPNESYENWHVTGPGFQLIALPGGSVAVF